MGDIGKFRDYPDLELTKAIRIADQIRRDYGGKISASNLARLFGIEPRGGGFANRVKDVTAYGLIEGKGEYKLTKLATQILTHPGDNEAKAQAFLNVPLFRGMHNEFKGQVPDNSEAFVARMKELTGENDDKAVSIRAGRLRNHYNEALRYLNPEAYQSALEQKEVETFVQTDEITQAQRSASDLLTVPSDYKTLVMPDTFILATKNDIESVRLLESQFRSWIKHLKDNLTQGKSTA